ncbi:hypothetical protein QC763_608540 [Podospora pseudopauciseta]|uniref:Formylmethionine deformylase-like protein n=1 Tax=Podospora pseudopauciseta TaxID=2093780 RepID=A0ABR0H6F3_9PEZI|nr:hypothetical protein QC763_608540 [Podospora pseudopauciseta]
MAAQRPEYDYRELSGDRLNESGSISNLPAATPLEWESLSQHQRNVPQHSPTAPWGHGRDGVEMGDLGTQRPAREDPFSDHNPLSRPYRSGGYHMLDEVQEPAKQGFLKSVISPTPATQHHDGSSPPDRGHPGPAGPSFFGRIRRSKWAMYICLIFGVACAAGHHVFYSTLNGKPATDQLVMQRYGTLLAFGAKAGLGAAVIEASHQRVWVTARKRVMTVGALDSLFSMTESLASFGAWEVLKGAKIAALLALFVWIAPIVVILTANTLQVELSRIVTEDRCAGVRTLNFSFEEIDEWRDPTKIGKYFEVPASIWNTTKKATDDDDSDEWFDYYTAPGLALAQTLTIGAFMGETVMRKNAQAETCGSGWNCTFEIKFTAPAYKCTELASGVGSKASNLTQQSGSIAPPFSTDLLLPKGIYSYYAFTTGGDYFNMQMEDVEPGGIPKTDRPYPKNLGAFRTDPIVWIGYSTRTNPGEPLPEKSSSPGWEQAFTPKLFACENYESSYIVQFNYTENLHSTNVLDVEYLRPVINTTYLPDIELEDGTADSVAATPQSNYVFPQNKSLYRRTAAYYSLSLIARSFLNGTVAANQKNANGVPMANTNVIQTKVLDVANNYFPVGDLMKTVQRFYSENIILSMLSNPQFTSVVWAAKPDEQSGIDPDVQREDVEGLKYPCQRSRVGNVYTYHVRDLWIVYSISIGLAVMGVVIGVLSVRENGGLMRNVKFSSFVAATRGEGLRRVEWGGADGGRVSEGVKGMRMRYGMVEVEGQGGKELKFGFGFEEDVTSLERNGGGTAVKRLTMLGASSRSLARSA